ncbi:MAG: hypothetical protein AAGD07_25720, partial [Planctomycetota bacterium]
PVHGELNPIRKGVSGQRWGLKEAIGGRWNVAKVNPIRLVAWTSLRKECDVRYMNNSNKCLGTYSSSGSQCSNLGSLASSGPR